MAMHVPNWTLRAEANLSRSKETRKLLNMNTNPNLKRYDASKVRFWQQEKKNLVRMKAKGTTLEKEKKTLITGTFAKFLNEKSMMLD